MRNPFSFFRIGALIAITVTLLGCEVGPDYEKPEIKLPESWVSANGVPSSADQNAIQQDWWKNFHDPVLEQLIVKASTGNLDLQLAEARIAQARAKRSAADANLLPSGDFKTNADRIAFPDALALPGLSNPLNIYQSQFDASWELDLFGGHRRDLESAEASLEASEASRDDAMVSLLAEVARTYIDIRQYQAELKIAQDTITSDAGSVNIAQQRFEVGSVPGFDLTQAKAQLQQAQTQLPYYRNLLAQAEYSMDVLLGEQPGATHALVSTVGSIPVTDKKLVLMAPASVIANRPDIRVVERKLASATAQQGVAVAKFFPDVSISGFFGLINTSASNLLTASSESWMMGGSVLWPILSYGTLSANLDAANAQQQEAMAMYRKTIIGALSDVERSMTAYTEQEQYRQALLKTVEANRHTDNIAHQRYKEGMTSFLEVQDTQRALYISQNQLAEAEAKTSQDVVAVYKSLGGGWKNDVARSR